VTPVVGQFNESWNDYLVVADHGKQTVYQVQPDAGELRSLFTDINVVALALDPLRRIVYLAYVQSRHITPYQIRKLWFESNVHSIIHYGQSDAVIIYTVSQNRFKFIHLLVS